MVCATWIPQTFTVTSEHIRSYFLVFCFTLFCCLFRSVVLFWNEEVAEAVRDKKIKYGKWKKENTEEARMEYKKSRQMQRELSLQQRKRNGSSGQMT